MMPFLADIRQWNCPAEFAAHLNRHSPRLCGWVQKVVIHHTWKPRAADWRGLASMESLKRYYIKLGWSSAPHLFICVGAPNPLHDGVFQLTPLNLPGTHAGTCNSSTIGVEVVGDYDNSPWPAPLATVVHQSVAHFLQWRGLPSTAIVGHRDCNSPKSCPGKAISIPAVITGVDYERKRMYK